MEALEAPNFTIQFDTCFDTEEVRLEHLALGVDAPWQCTIYWRVGAILPEDGAPAWSEVGVFDVYPAPLERVSEGPAPAGQGRAVSDSSDGESDTEKVSSAGASEDEARTEVADSPEGEKPKRGALARIWHRRQVRIGVSSSRSEIFSDYDQSALAVRRLGRVGIDVTLARQVVREMSLAMTGSADTIEPVFLPFDWLSLLAAPDQNLVDFAIGTITIGEERKPSTTWTSATST